MTATNNEPAWTVRDVCAYHKIGRTTLWKALKDGTGPECYRIGKAVRFPAEAARRWRGQGEHGTGGE